MSQNHIALFCGSEVPWKLPQIFRSDKHWCTEIFIAPVLEANTTKADDALSHWCNQNLHCCAWDLKLAQQQQEWSLETSQLCPQAPLSSAHLPVKTLEPRLISNGVHLNPHASLAHTYMFLHTAIPTALDLILRQLGSLSNGLVLCFYLKVQDSFSVNALAQNSPKEEAKLHY